MGKIYLVLEYAAKGDMLRWDAKNLVFHYPDPEAFKDIRYI
jgi:hypothetical protein